MTTVCLRVMPPKILPWLSDEDRERNVLLLDFEVDREDDRTLRVDLNVVFNPIAVRRGKLRRADYYIGSTGADISVQAHHGMIRKHTAAATLDVNYSNSVNRARKSALNLTPAFKTKAGSTEIESSLGSISREAAEQWSFIATFSSEERYLAPVKLDDTIKWSISMPRGEKVVRDFLIGNLPLFAVCSWAATPRAGRILVRPSDVQFFGSDRRPIGTARSLLMWFVLWRRGVVLQDPDGFAVEFEDLAP